MLVICRTSQPAQVCNAISVLIGNNEAKAKVNTPHYGNSAQTTQQ